MPTDYAHLFQLPTADKLQLVEALWDDIATGIDPLPVPQWQLRVPRWQLRVPQWQIDELQRRKALRLESPQAVSPWEDARQRIVSRRVND